MEQAQLADAVGEPVDVPEAFAVAAADANRRDPARRHGTPSSAGRARAAARSVSNVPMVVPLMSIAVKRSPFCSTTPSAVRPDVTAKCCFRFAGGLEGRCCPFPALRAPSACRRCAGPSPFRCLTPHRARLSCHSRLSLSRIPMRRGESWTTGGPLVAKPKLFSAHHCRNVSTRLSWVATSRRAARCRACSRSRCCRRRSASAAEMRRRWAVSFSRRVMG
jgi:hypothetical protein